MNNHHTPSKEFWGCNCETKSLHSYEESYCKLCDTLQPEGHTIFIEDILSIVNAQELKTDKKTIHLKHKLHNIKRIAKGR